MVFSALRRGAISGALMLVLFGCSSTVQTDDLLTHKISHPLHVEKYQTADWYKPSKHELDPLSIIHPDGFISKGVRLTVEDSQNTVIYFGGSPFRDGENDVDIMGQFAFLGLNVIMFKNRGIDSHGTWPSLTQLKQDAKSVFEYSKKNYKNEFMIVHGTAMSSFLVAEIAKEQQLNVNAVVLEGAVTTVEELTAVKNRFPWLPKSWLPEAFKHNVSMSDSLEQLDNYELLTAFDGPVLLLAAEDDDMVPVELPQNLYNALPGIKKSLTVVPNADENDLLLHDDSLAAYTMFVRKYGWEE
ncbi:alpha/beta hydrolase [Photobacterium japonica]|uniref:alpha/beta hydrolase n=1 Tax=Photobacterium japonica TaxID=2910235 RepID=UPI003D0EB63B